MDNHTIQVLIFSGIALIAGVTSSDTVTKETESLCNLSAAKRMLNGLGINSSKTSCLLQSKRDFFDEQQQNVRNEENIGHIVRDVASLVTSYIEHSMGSEKRSILDEFEELLLKELVEKRNHEKRGAYCCSPQCDKFMARMGNPHNKLISCN